MHGNIIIFQHNHQVQRCTWNDFKNSDRAEICFVKGDDTWVHHFPTQNKTKQNKTKHFGMQVWALTQSFRGC